ncbi:nucleotidyltransferase family protein [Roseateles sp. DAIF2]|uniref:nucleotidyltransferase domain-containing protein n=1 Tax=Roseateles sp. DAIF2 TaxID=2714952 RepID=UPI0018A288C4|nr:nucleotidyltransferase family protein [Roseateles sp. DAIF2]QPF71910.1 nucleotidyltransferase family protein [Roseateles sp. DAIF2]
MKPNGNADLLIRCLREPAQMAALDEAGWDLLIRQARRSRLLGRLAMLALPFAVPAAPARHLQAARHVADSLERAIFWEAGHIQRALRELEAPVLLLKGAAYALAGFGAGRGRLLSDIDIMVPLARIGEAESALIMQGWVGSEISAHDQRYYREWMHEIPPMRHMRRSSVIDVHHNILPRTGRLTVDADRLLARALPLPGHPGLHRLCDPDLVLHSACHLFLDGEFDKGLRDLADIDALLRELSARDPGFWDALQARAWELGLARVLLYALRYGQRLLGTPVPAALLQDLQRAAPGGWRLRLLDGIFERALRPDHHSCADRWSGPARRFLYLRGHWLRMPLPLLVMHLTIKALARKPRSA